jgi:cell division transport system permease protein
MSAVNSTLRILNYGIQGFRRNVWLSVIAIITMTLTIVTISVFAIGNVAATAEYHQINVQLDDKVFIVDSASDADVANFLAQVKDQPDVTQTTYIDKGDALRQFLSDPLLPSYVRTSITADNNPLPREIDVRFSDPNQIAAFDAYASQARFKGVVDHTSHLDSQTAISNYLKVVNFVRVFGISFSVFFVVIALVVILNTIRLTIFSRREEIEVMRLVGATSGFIRGPFLVEGVLFGLIGALLAGVLAWLVLYQVQRLPQYGISNSFVSAFSSSFSYLTSQASFNRFFRLLFLSQLGVGIVFGTLCSGIAIRRYLRE